MSTSRPLSTFVATLASGFLMLAGGAASVRAQSALDGFDPNANGAVNVVVAQPDGKILIGGDFTAVLGASRNYIARLNPDGTLDAAFNPNSNGNVYAIAVQPDGKILVGGNFTSIGGATSNRIARLNPDGALDAPFNPNADGLVRSIVVQPDGNVLVGGFFTNVGGATRNRIARLDPTTGLADSFDPNATGGGFVGTYIRSIAVQADGKILVGGSFSSIGGQTRNRIARLDPTTGFADSFDPNANNPVFAIAVQADGKILASGRFTSIGGATRNRIARLDPTTGLPDSFDPNANNDVFSIAEQPDGKILAGGVFSSIGGQTRNRIARLHPTTGLADSFDPNANGSIVNAVAVQSDGKILAGGDFTSFAPNGGAAVTRNHIARLETDGRLDRTLDLSAIGTYVAATALQPDGKILIGGDFTTVLGVPRSNIARLNTDGTLDTAFNPNANDDVLSIAVQADGKILVGGFFTSIGGETRKRMARLDVVTGAADSFNPSAESPVRSIVVQADGKILVGGDFSGFNSIGGQLRNGIARLDASTGLADSFSPNANDAVSSIAVQADGKILVGGWFTSIGGETRNRMARLDAITGAADSFNPNANSVVRPIAFQADGKILVGGNFTSIGGATRNNIARLDATTGSADSFDPNANNSVYSIAVQADGKILAGGLFTSVGGQTRNRIARLNPATGLADSFDPNANSGGFSAAVHSIAVQADGKILAGGTFSNIGGQPRNLFARLSNNTAALQNLGTTQSTATWTRSGASLQLDRVTFESSTDNVNYTPLGEGTAFGSNWTLGGLNLPTQQNIYIRARGYYRGGFANGSESIAESVRNAFITTADPTPTPTPTPVPGRLGNISTRLRVETADNVLIGGFIVTGTQPKRVIIRAIGTSLPFADKLADPILELHGPNGLIEANDNWVDSPNKQAIIDSTIPPASDLESAIVQTLPANSAGYTAIVRGVNDGTGIGVVETYDLDGTVDSKLANISTRGFVQTGDNVLIAGTIVVGQVSQRVIIRAIGPSLPIAGKMENPTLELRDANGTKMQENDNWMDSPDKLEIIASGIPPTHNLESAIVATLPANDARFTAIVRGVNDTTGIAVVEIYALD